MGRVTRFLFESRGKYIGILNWHLKIILKADLVSIQSSEENDFVTELKGTHQPWIGGVRITAEFKYNFVCRKVRGH